MNNDIRRPRAAHGRIAWHARRQSEKPQAITTLTVRRGSLLSKRHRTLTATLGRHVRRYVLTSNRGWSNVSDRAGDAGLPPSHASNTTHRDITPPSA